MLLKALHTISPAPSRRRFLIGAVAAPAGFVVGYYLLGRSARLARALVALARAHRRTPMIGRTFLQHAVPISFGVKAAQWLVGRRPGRYSMADVLGL